jgi:hypothetical protein
MRLFLYLIIPFTLFAVDIEVLSDYKVGLQKAKAENKLVYVLISSTECRWCRKFEKNTLKDSMIVDRLKKEFVVVKLLREKDVIDEKFETSPIPRHYFLDSDANIVYSALGYRDKVLFDSFMDNAQERKNKFN